MAAAKDTDAKIAELQTKIAIERKVREGAAAMLKKLTDKNAREQCETNVQEADRRIEFLEEQMRKLQLKKLGGAAGGGAGTGISPQGSEDALLPPPPADMQHGSSSGSFQHPWGPRKSSYDGSGIGAPVSPTGTGGVLSASSGTTGGIVSSASFSGTGTPRSASNNSLFAFMAGKTKNIVSAPNSGMNTPKAMSSHGGSATSLSNVGTGDVGSPPVYVVSSGGTAPVSGFECLKSGTAYSSEKLRYRLNHVRAKLDLETKVKTGTENLYAAIMHNKAASDGISGGGAGGGAAAAAAMGLGDPKQRMEVERKISEANARVAFLTKAEHHYSKLFVEDEDADAEPVLGGKLPPPQKTKKNRDS
ncbi:hypothetical protein HK102_009887 [Quaeritorhiza haematococci]|nr:hypothetical protein HK102_009887 [Quaeritorhiza haematococci]